jgi:hypothetical protein
VRAAGRLTCDLQLANIGTTAVVPARACWHQRDSEDRIIGYALLVRQGTTAMVSDRIDDGVHAF